MAPLKIFFTITLISIIFITPINSSPINCQSIINAINPITALKFLAGTDYLVAS